MAAGVYFYTRTPVGRAHMPRNEQVTRQWLICRVRRHLPQDRSREGAAGLRSFHWHRYVCLAGWHSGRGISGNKA